METLYYVVQNKVTDEYVSGDVQNDAPFRRCKKLEKATRFPTLKEAKFCIFYFGLNKLDWQSLLICESGGRIYAK
jgi:hypothetical protein